MSASFELPALTQTGLEALLRGLAGNPSAPPEVLVRLVAADVDRSALARRRDLPANAAAALADDRDATVRSELASHPTLPPAVQVVLAGDADPRVRGRLAEGAEYFTTVGVHGHHVPDPLPREVYELLARDPEPKVRRALAFNRRLPDDVRARMLDDADSRTAAIAATEWPLAPTGRIGELLSRVTGASGRQMLLMHLDGPLPAEAARAIIADIDAAAGAANSEGLLRQVAEVADLDDGLADRFLASAGLRATVAANPTLSAEHVAELAGDPDNEVRAAVVARYGLDPVLRESIPVDYDDRSSKSVGWLLTESLSDQDRLALARSRHQIFRKTLAMRPDLPDEIVEILAGDESFAVRLFVCERQPNAPGRLLAQIAEQWTSYSRWDMLAHKNFPAEAADRLARSAEVRDRAVAAAHPGLPADTVEALLTDDEATVRGRAATNPAVPADRLIELLGAADSAVAAGAAANRLLPVTTMHHLLDQAGL
ncbi:hypothetical protein OHB41_44640 [Streptomyces sp. NBC_01571]|uniref:hypothetical protein n=1 Tax=Streptomyces sp. NBC_01571 TaxID=2975883 RepID=UPI002254ED42|nr:hypothetical protein [Streptomyces sp. NBC_01571]MCX4580137.1 hypothetical protein [Streptomyces sp. NBC_01571]